jgi:hypothetical protein
MSKALVGRAAVASRVARYARARNCFGGAVFVLSLVFSVAGFAQTIGGEVLGVVKDASGGNVPRAKLTATNEATGTKSSVTANGDGEYRVSDLLVGNYTLSAEAPGFANAEIKGIAVELNKTVTMNVTLQVGTVATSVAVTEAGTVIDTTTAQIQNNFSQEQSQQVPSAGMAGISGLGVLNLSLLNAGVSSSGGVGYGAGPSIGGQRPTSNSFTIEGVDNNEKSVTGPIVYVSNENIAEFTVLQNEFRAEYGHSSGGQFNSVIRGGTNSYRGSIYEYFQNRNLFANDQAFANQGILSPPRYDQNRLGANYGGPVKRNKLFFFGGFEYNPLGQAATASSIIYAPTAAGYTTLGTAAGINATNLGVMKQYAVAPATSAGAPTITVGGVSVPTGIIQVAGPSFQNAYFSVASFDYDISDRDKLRGRDIYNRTDSISTTANLPAFWTPVPLRFHLASLSETHTFSPSVINEFRAGYNREFAFYAVGNQTFPGLDAFPNLKFDDINLQVGPNPSFPQGSIRNGLQLSDSVTWAKGNHTFKFGYEFHDYIATTHFTQNIRGSYDYTTLALYLQDQRPDVVNIRSIGDPVFYGNNLAHYFFAQDTWRLTSKLTVDLGLRYEYQTVQLGARQQNFNSIASVPGLIQFNAPKTDPNGWGPRIGIAYSPGTNGDTVIRLGFSRATDLVYDNVPVNGPPPQFTTSVNLQGTTGSDFLKNGGISAAKFQPGVLNAAQARAATASFFPDRTLPYSLNWTAAVEKVIAKDYTVEVRYVGTRGVHQLIQMQIDRLNTPVTASRNIPTFFTPPSAAVLASLPLTVGQLRPSAAAGNLSSAGIFLDPQYVAAGFAQPITAYMPQGWLSYNGLALQVKRRFTNGFQMLGAYTWSHNIDNITATLATSALSQRRPQDFGNLTPEKADSALDRRQRLTIQTIYDVPWMKGSRSWFAKNLIGNWEIVPIYTYESPEYYTVYSGTNGNLNGDSGAIYRSIVNPNAPAGTASTVYGLDRNGNRIAATAAASSVNNVVAWVATNANARYVQAAAGAFANGGRNTQASRPIDNVDLTLLKRFTITERIKLESSLQAFNLFNHAQFIPGSINNVGRVNTNASTAYTTLTNVLFNDPTRAFPSNARSVTLTAKITF